MRKSRLFSNFVFFVKSYGKLSVSYYSTVRVRFAPSPTGMLHLGGLRTALFNYLFARSRDGKFILRIEDTDQTRIVPEAVQKLESVLQWAGLVPDESPSAGGSYGPYLQSQRLHLYRDSAEMLLKSEHCYHCFCTERRLELLRKEAARRGETPRYDNKCRHLTSQEVQEKMSQNVPYVIRFKYEPLESAWTDLVYGVMHEKSVGESLEGDFVVVKTDGYPTYHFANVVDDHFMKISHVLRGEEWTISTPKHLQMYKAFGWEPPLYAHLPLILNSDGTKLSKRQGDIKVEMFKEKNYDPNAILNYLTTVGRGFTSSTEGKTLEEMINLFSLDTLTSHSARLQPEKLKHLNRKHLYRKFHSKHKQHIIEETKQLVHKHYTDRVTDSHVLDSSYIERILDWALDHRISHLEDLLSKSLEYIWVYPDTNKVKFLLSKNRKCKTIIQDTVNKLNLVETFEESMVKEVLMCYCKEEDLKMKQYMIMLRGCLSEQKEGPSIAEMMETLGKLETLKRLTNAVNSLKY
ncbi:probable glutamate--tRNA ligase, mitochondrial [Mercenaria mercenaria]|uniref:probable glutamate--tRNA ligase, mitochondrial n=1 Tax=Mercenaria mercenaria TaxID=6596 RepID=UPI00234FAEAB|nr:probable glutamate--tRNA ligase, mitochondrial [Mercenaria mercenaria]